MKRINIVLLVLMVSASLFCANAKNRVDDLLKKMTLEEKIGQLNLNPGGDITTGPPLETEIGSMVAKGEIGAVLNVVGIGPVTKIQKVAVEKSRLGIPLIIGLDVIHGYKTTFPIPLALSCTWDLEGIERVARIAAEECSSCGINWTYSPMVDVAFDARWGRVAEGAGEDPYWGSLVAGAYVRGYQGTSPDECRKDPSHILACVKHYALYSASEAGRDYNTVDMSHLRMYNQFFPPYKAAVKAGVASVMSSFNIVDGRHATANKWLLTDVLRDQWGFGGFVVTDYGSIDEMTNWGYGDIKANSARALKAGTDMDMCSDGFIENLADLVREGKVSEAEVDRACRRVLEAKEKLGLFDNPYRHIDPERAKKLGCAEYVKAARDIAAESFVLLKNQENVLPLKKEGKIALIGPLANAKTNMAGCWAVNYDPFTSVKEAFEKNLEGKATILYAQGCNAIDDARYQEVTSAGNNIERVDSAKALNDAIDIARQADVIVCCLGELQEHSGESASRSNLELPSCQMTLLRQLNQLGKPVVLLNFSGRPTIMKWENENIPAIMNVWFSGSEGANAICDVVFGDKAPCGRLTTSMPDNMGQLPIYYQRLNTGRPMPADSKLPIRFRSCYIDGPNDPLFPFGYGLTYTTFSYGEPTATATANGYAATVSVTNTGNRDAWEVVQLYIHDVAASVARPVKELKGYKRIFLKAGETANVTIPFDKESLSFYDENGTLTFEPGEFEIMLGPNSRDLKITSMTVE